MKNLYFVEESARGDLFQSAFTFDRAEAERAAQTAYDRLTAREQAEQTVHLCAVTVDVAEGESAQDVYDRLLDDDVMPDYSEYIEIRKES